MNAAENQVEVSSGTLSLTFEALKQIDGVNDCNGRGAGRIPLITGDQD